MKIVLSLFIIFAGILTQAQANNCAICDFVKTEKEAGKPIYWKDSIGRNLCSQFVKAFDDAKAPYKKSDHAKSLQQVEGNMYGIYSSWIAGYVESINRSCGTQFVGENITDAVAQQCALSGNEQKTMGHNLLIVLKERMKPNQGGQGDNAKRYR